MAAESKNIIKKTNLKISEIKKRYQKDFYTTIIYEPQNICVKNFDPYKPKVVFYAQDTIPLYLSEVLENLTKSKTQYLNYLKTIPSEKFPTPSILLMEQFTQQSGASPKVLTRNVTTYTPVKQKDLPLLKKSPFLPKN